MNYKILFENLSSVKIKNFILVYFGELSLIIELFNSYCFRIKFLELKKKMYME